MKYLFIGIVAISIALLSFKEDKKFAVSFTQQEWQARYNWIEVAKEQLKRSDLPSKDVIFITDSLLGKFQSELAIQLQPQFQAASDTIKKKK